MTTTSLAAVLHRPGEPLSVEPIDIADPQPAEVLIRTVTAAICGTDVHFARGRYPFPTPTVLGHEATGVVEAVGDGVTHVEPGQTVIVCDRYPCGHCAACASGDMAYCTDTSGKARQKMRITSIAGPVRQYLGISAFAQHMLVDANAVIGAPAGLDAAAAAMLSCGITTGMSAVLNNTRPAAGSTVAVIGCGAVGLGAVIAARLSGAEKILAVDPEEHRLKAALDLGATDTVHAGEQDVTEAILQALPGGVDRSIEAVGLPETAVQALNVLRRGGHATVLGMMPSGAELTFPARTLQEGRTIGGAVMGRALIHADVPGYARLAVRGAIDLAPLASTRRPLAEINDALEDAANRRGIRHLIDF